MALFSSSLQVLAAIAIVIILFILAYYIFNRETINITRQNAQLRSRIDVFKGIKDMAAIGDGETYNTTNDAASIYIPLKSSVNQKGGIEFTYNFWLFKDDSFNYTGATTTRMTTDGGINQNDVILLLKGNNKVQNYNSLCSGNTTTTTIKKNDIYIKCPLIKLENSGDALTVEFNTEESADIVHEGAKNTCTSTTSNWNDKHSYKVSLRGFTSKPMFDQKWFMVTVVIQDTYPSDPLPFRNKVRVRIYINSVLELDQYVDTKFNQTDDEPASILKPNDGNLYVMPTISWVTGNSTIETSHPSNSQPNQIMMADLAYFNYVVNVDDIASIYKAGYNKSIAVSPKGTGGSSVLYDMSYSDGKTRQLIST